MIEFTDADCIQIIKGGHCGIVQRIIGLMSFQDEPADNVKIRLRRTTVHKREEEGQAYGYRQRLDQQLLILQHLCISAGEIKNQSCFQILVSARMLRDSDRNICVVKDHSPCYNLDGR